MTDIPDSSWSETDASNNQPSPAGWPEGMLPSGVNNSARSDKGGVKRFWNRINAVKTTAGSSTAYTLTYDVAAASYYDGELFSFVMDEACGSAPTLNINGLGARNLRKFVGGAWTNLESGDLAANQTVTARYNGSDQKFDILSPVLSFQVNSSYRNIALNGMRIQMGQVIVGSGTATVTFSPAFGSNPYVFIAANGNSGTLSAMPSVTNILTTQFDITNSGANNINYLWLAIGGA